MAKFIDLHLTNDEIVVKIYKPIDFYNKLYFLINDTTKQIQEN